METQTGNLMWRNEPGRLVLARWDAQRAKCRGQFAEAHSIMLSAYITALTGNPAEGHNPVWFGFLALWHAWCMFWRRNELNHNQLDVWLQFVLHIRAKLSLSVGKSFLERVWYSSVDRKLYRLAQRAVDLAKKAGKPHQIALAHMTCAEVRYAIDFHRDMVERRIKSALDLEPQIRAESDQPQGLRQLVRILRKAGWLYCQPGMYNVVPVTGRNYLWKAVELARGEADAPDQLPKIESLLTLLKF